MKVITLYQPWASAIPEGWKLHETRSWSTTYRGPILIHAALQNGITNAEIHRKATEAFEVSGVPPPEVWPKFPRGMVVAIARLVHVGRVEHVGEISPLDRAFGDYSSGRFAWKLEDVKRIKLYAMKGSQGLRDVAPEDLKHIEVLA